MIILGVFGYEYSSFVLSISHLSRSLILTSQSGVGGIAAMELIAVALISGLTVTLSTSGLVT